MSMIFALLLGQHAEFGSPTIQAFRDEVKAWGYDVRSTSTDGALVLTKGGVSVTLTMGFSGKLTVASVSGDTVFALPRYLPQAELTDWSLAHIGKNASVTSSLDGAVEIETQLVDSPSDPVSKVKARLELYVANVRSVDEYLKPLGGKRLADPWQIGEARFEETARVSQFGYRDASYLVKSCGWRMVHDIGGSSHGWAVPSTIEGVDVFFFEDPPTRFDLNSRKASTFTLIFSGKYDREALAKWNKDEGQRLAWAKAEVYENTLRLHSHIDVGQGVTVGELKDQILKFARNAKALKLQPARPLSK